MSLATPKTAYTIEPELLKKIAERAEQIRNPWLSDYGHHWQTTESTILAYLELTTAPKEIT